MTQPIFWVHLPRNFCLCNSIAFRALKAYFVKRQSRFRSLSTWAQRCGNVWIRFDQLSVHQPARGPRRWRAQAGAPRRRGPEHTSAGNALSYNAPRSRSLSTASPHRVENGSLTRKSAGITRNRMRIYRVLAGPVRTARELVPEEGLEPSRGVILGRF